jgi:hypothetical protein
VSRDYTPGLFTVTSWNRRATRSEADERLVYRGEDAAEAVRIFEGLTRWKRRGLVQMVGPTGLVSTACRTGDAAKDWTTRYAHPGGRT